ncbi:MAG: SMP-30/gluconolactonase/LRE family protein [Verrucomicrobiota bacterium]
MAENFRKENLRPLVEGHSFTEGPTLTENGDLLFTSPKKNAIVRYSIGHQSTSLFYRGEFSVSALFQRDALYATQGSRKRVILIQSPDRFVPLADTYKGRPFNKPNDLWVSPAGHVYFTDPNYGRNPLSQDGEFAYMIRQGGEVSRIDATFKRPNGIVGSEDGKTLFITDAGDSKTYKFLLDEKGNPGPQTLFTEIGGDGMTLDRHGNLYLGVPRQKALVVMNPRGREIGRISDFGCTNLCFGPDGKTLYITRKPGLWALTIY